MDDSFFWKTPFLYPFYISSGGETRLTGNFDHLRMRVPPSNPISGSKEDWEDFTGEM
jgi:hypothetical protein